MSKAVQFKQSMQAMHAKQATHVMHATQAMHAMQMNTPTYVEAQMDDATCIDTPEPFGVSVFSLQSPPVLSEDSGSAETNVEPPMDKMSFLERPEKPPMDDTSSLEKP